MKRSLLALIALVSGSVGAYVGIPSLSGAATPSVVYQLPDSTATGFYGTPHTTQLFDEHDTDMAGQSCLLTLTVINNESGRAGTDVSLIGVGYTITAKDVEATPFKPTAASQRVVIPAKLRAYVSFGDDGAISIRGTITVSDCDTPATVPVPPTTSQPPVVSPIALPKFTG